MFPSDVSVQRDIDLLLNSLDVLEKCAFNPNLEYKSVASLKTVAQSSRTLIIRLLFCPRHYLLVLSYSAITVISNCSEVLTLAFLTADGNISLLFVLSFSMGCVLGLALLLTALCKDEQKHLHFHVTRSLEKILSSLQDSSGRGRILQEVPYSNLAVYDSCPASFEIYVSNTDRTDENLLIVISFFLTIASIFRHIS